MPFTQINLPDLIYFLRSRLKWIFLSLLAGMAIASLFTLFFLPRLYTSTARIFPRPEVENGRLDYTQINANHSMLDSYIALIQGNTIVDAVANELELDSEMIQNSLEVQRDDQAAMIILKASNTDPVTSYRIVSTAIDVFYESLDKMGIPEMTTVDKAKIPSYPSSPNLWLNLGLGALGGFLISLLLFIIQFLMDDHIHNQEEVEHLLAIPTLGVIPDYASFH